MTENIKDFIANRPNAGELRKKYPELEELLQGEFTKDNPNKYEIGGRLAVASWELSQGKPKNPTYGIFSPGDYRFPTGDNIETLIVLDGKAETSNPTEKIAEKYLKITATDVLVLNAKDNVTYLCLYEPKQK